MSPACTKIFRDDVYAEGVLQRVDKSFIARGVKKLLGVNNNYRPPYGGKVISLYQFNKPSDSILSEYKCSPSIYGDSLKTWYGIKYDFEKQTRSAKFVFEDHSKVSKHPPINVDRVLFYAKIHELDGTVSPWVDAYFVATEDYMKNWCDKYNLNYPTSADIKIRPWCYSIVWNEITGEMKTVKAYVRHWKKP